MKKGDTKLSVKRSAARGKAAKDPNKPMRPANAFFVFLEAFRKQYKEEHPTINSVVAVGKAGGAKWKLMSESAKAPFVAEAEQRKTAISSVERVMSNNDLLIQILLRLPVLSLILCKSVAKNWLSLIKEPNVTFRQKLDPLSGLFLTKFSDEEDHSDGSHNSDFGSFSYDFVPLDIRIPICRSSILTTKFTFGPDVHGDFEILDSCNGLFLCRTLSRKLYVYNPSITNMFKVLQDPDNVTYVRNMAGSKLAFDPIRSPHYKVIVAQIMGAGPNIEWVQIRTFSSETGIWTLFGYQFSADCFVGFEDGVYWNDAIYWPASVGKITKLDIMNQDPALTDLQTPLTLFEKVHDLYELFVSRGCLLLSDKHNPSTRSQCFTIFEKRNIYSEWSLKYIVNLDDVIKPYPKERSIWPIILCVVLGEREDDSFLVMELDTKVVIYKIMSKTLTTIYDLGPNDDLISFSRFIPSFANV